MTEPTFDADRIALALERIADALEQAVLERIPSPPVRYAEPPAYVGDPQELPPPPMMAPAPDALRPPTAPPALSLAAVCPTHGTPWSLKPAGVSKKTGQAYSAFWACDQKNADGTWCKNKPLPATA